MNTLKRKLTAFLLVFAMLFSLMPALPQAAEAADGDGYVSGDYVTLTYKTPQSPVNPNTIHLNVYIEGQAEPVQTATVNDVAITSNNITAYVSNNEYEIAGEDGVDISWSGNQITTSWDVNDNLDMVNILWTNWGGSEVNIDITLRTAQTPPVTADTPSGIYQGGGLVEYRFYDPQLLKMIHLYDSDETITTDTEIEKVTVNLIREYSPGVSSFDALNQNREEDYLNVTGSNVAKRMMPSNVENVVVTYNGGQTITIPASELRFVWNGYVDGENYYSVEANDDDVHVVYFYNETDGHIANNYFPYDVKFVNHGESLGDNMPADPTYEGGTFYRFINWDLESWDGSTHQPFMSTTIVNDDYTVFARKAASDLSGTEVHVVNGVGSSENELLDLVAKLYSEQNGTDISGADIDRSKVEINVYDNEGNQTNDDAAMNEWATSGDVEYYNLSNCNVVWNDHLSQADLSKIRVTFELDGEVHSVDIPIGEYADQLSIYMASTENIIELIVNKPQEVIEDPNPDPDPDPEPGSTAPSNKITIDLYVDGEHVTDKASYGQYLKVAPVATNWDSASGYDEGSWNEGSYENGVVSYSRWHYDCKDINFTAQNGYVIEGIEADVVNGQSGWQGFKDNDGTILVDNVNGDSTVKVHLRSTYTVNYYEPDGTTIHETQTGLVADTTKLIPNSEDVPKPIAGESYNDEPYLAMEDDQDPVTASGKQQPYDRVYVAEGLSTTTNIVDLPDVEDGSSVSGWWIEGNEQVGEPTHEVGETYPVNSSDDKNGDKIIAFYSKSTQIPANWGKLTIEKTVDKETAKPGDTVTYTITVTNNTGKDLTDVKVTDKLDENLTFVSAEPAGSYANDVWTIDKLANGSSATLTITAKVNDDVADVSVIKNTAIITDAKDGDDNLPDGDKPKDEVEVTVEPKDPTPPSEEDITKLINGAEVTVNCTNEAAGHEPLTVKFDEVNDTKFETTQSGDTITVTVDNGAFIANYVANRNNIPHSYVEKGSDLTLTLKYVENGWVLDNEDNNVTINTICQSPQVPSDDDLIKLLNQATADVECITTGSNHNKESFNFGEVTDYKFTTEKTDPYTITVEVDPAAFIENYDEIYEPEVHTFVQSEDVEQDVQLVVKFVDGAWVLTKNTINIKVSCGFDLTGIDKTLVTKGELENVAKEAGVEVTNYFLPASMEDTVTVPYNGSVTLLYAITVEGKGGADFAVQDPFADLVNTPINTSAQISKEDTTGMFIGTIPEGANSVTFYVSRTFTAADIEGNELSNTVELFGSNGSTVEPDPDTGNKDEETIPGEEGKPAGTVTITPADLTIYEGGNGGYDAVVDEDGNTVSEAESASLPHPLFKITVPEGSEVNPEDLTFTNGSNVWKVVHDGDNLYHFEVTEDWMTPVRVTYTDENDNAITSDAFTPTQEGDSYTTYTISLYAGSNDPDFSNVTAIAKDDGARYAIDAQGKTGELTVRAVDGEQEDVVSDIVSAEDAENIGEVDAGEAVAVEPEDGTTYTLNNTNVEVNESDSKPSLLFDGIIDDSVNRTEMLEDKVDEALGGADADREYEIKYIDLVDANNGNAWIASSEGTDIFWGYPEGTDENTDFQILHFKGLHRDGATSGFDPADLAAIDVDNEDQLEHVTITKTDEGILFHVDEANFSPYALTWETDNGGSGDDGDDHPWWPDWPWHPGGGDGDGDVDKPELERGDHYAYIVGYEDGTVRPQNNITRAEVATIFFRLLTQESREAYFTNENDFSDVSADSWYNNTVSTLVNAGIIVGYEDGTFRPDAPITRAELAAIASRFDDLSGGTSDLTDIAGHWAEDAINSAYDKGWVGGYPDGTFRPDQNITRAEVMSLVNRVLDREVDEDGMLPDMITWSDNVEGAWYYEAVQEATNSHDYDREEGEVEDWTDINEAPDWPKIEADLLEMIGA